MRFDFPKFENYCGKNGWIVKSQVGLENLKHCFEAGTVALYSV